MTIRSPMPASPARVSGLPPYAVTNLVISARERVISAAFEIGAASLGTLVTDTIKTVDDSNIITSTPARSELRAVQTPQVFEKELYRLAIDEARGDLSEFTDDCALIENLGGEVEIVEGSSENIKLTTPIDIVIAESILKNRLG